MVGAGAAGRRKEWRYGVDAAIERGEGAMEEDFAPHAAITDATGNPRFRQFLDFLGRFIIPLASVRIRARNRPRPGRRRLPAFASAPRVRWYFRPRVRGNPAGADRSAMERIRHSAADR